MMRFVLVLAVVALSAGRTQAWIARSSGVLQKRIYRPHQITASTVGPDTVRSSGGVGRTTSSSTSSTTSSEIATSLNEETSIPVTFGSRAMLDKSLVIFVVDTSLPGGLDRINAVKGSICSLMPRVRCCVVTCSGNNDEAEVIMEPTASFIKANHMIPKLLKSVGGNLASGINLAVHSSREALTSGFAKDVMIAIVADSKSHGLYHGTSDCENDEGVDAMWAFKNAMCDIELELAASDLQNNSDSLVNTGKHLRSVIIDTEGKHGATTANAEWSEEGARLATASGAQYYHIPDLSDTELIRILVEVQSIQKTISEMGERV